MKSADVVIAQVDPTSDAHLSLVWVPITVGSTDLIEGRLFG